MIDLTTTNALLGVLTGVALLQMAGLIVGGVLAWRAWNRGIARLDAIEQQVEETLRPFAARAETILARVDRVSERVDVGTERLDHALAVTGHGAHLAMTAVNGNVQRTAAFAAALASGGRAALHAWRAGRDRRRRERLVSDGAPVGPALEPRVASLSPYVNPHRTEESHVSI